MPKRGKFVSVKHSPSFLIIKYTQGSKSVQCSISRNIPRSSGRMCTLPLGKKKKSLHVKLDYRWFRNTTSLWGGIGGCWSGKKEGREMCKKLCLALNITNTHPRINGKEGKVKSLWEQNTFISTFILNAFIINKWSPTFQEPQ